MTFLEWMAEDDHWIWSLLALAFVLLVLEQFLVRVIVALKTGRDPDAR